jgi:hypothetical protein
MGLGLADAVHDRIIDIPFELDTGKLPDHPDIERVVEEQIGEDR